MSGFISGLGGEGERPRSLLERMSSQMCLGNDITAYGDRSMWEHQDKMLKFCPLFLATICEVDVAVVS